MARKLFVMLAATVLTVMPLSVNALGFGNIKVSSALNERMDAEIDLLGASEADIKDLKVSLASHNAFLRAGIERSAPLLGLRFSINRRSNGNYYIKVASRDNVREPFLNFLLEMNWKNGRMLREYTVLLDPPDRMQRQPTVVAAAKTEAPTIVEQEEKIAEANQEAPFVPAPMPAPLVELEPAPVVVDEVDDGQPFPRVPIAEYKESDAQVAVAAKVDEPEVAVKEPEPLIPPAPALDMEPLIPELQPEAKPEAVAPEAGGLPADSGQPLEQPVEIALEQPFEEIDQVYPTIPLSAYSDDAATDRTTQMSADGEAMDPVTGDLDYGITRKGDSLWKVAEKLRGDSSVTIHQIMMALLKSNPAAFVNGNVHRMKVGQVLRIEDSSLLTAMSAKQAANEYMAQTQSWEEYRQQMATAETAMQPEVVSDTGTITPTEETPAAPAGELILAAPESTDLTAGVGTTENQSASTERSDADLLREEVRKALADAKTEQGRNTVLNERLRELEGELGNLQRSMTVQDDELAALQQQLSEFNKVEEPVAAVEEQQAVPAPEEQAPAAITQPEPEVETETTEQVAVAVEPAVVEQTPAGDLTAESGLAPRPEEMQAPVAPPVQVIPPEPGFMDKAVSMLGGVVAAVGGVLSTMSFDPLYMGILGGSVLLIILAVIVMKRRKSGDKFQESILTGAAEGGTSTSAAASSGVAAAEPASLDTNFSEESSFLSDFAISGAGAIQAEDSEVDPLTEADVFMAYGRHEAAEERLNEAIKQDPNRKELKLKLLELYNTTKNRDAFEPLAEEFYASMGDSASGDPMWEKVLIMGAEIASDNPLFSNAPESAAVSKQEEDFSDISNASMSDSQVMDIGLDTGVFNTTDFDAAPAAGHEEESSASLDFNLDFGDTSSEESTASLDFNLSDDEETATLKAPAKDDAEGEDTASIDLGTGMDFSLDDSSDKVSAPEPTMTMEAPNLEDSGMSMDFDMGGSDAESTASIDFDMGTSADEGFSLDAGADDTGGMDLNLDATDASSGMDDIGAVDEVGTKLDLAKAYIDMGDPEGARSILDEVMDEGNDSQKQEAQQLIQQIV